MVTILPINGNYSSVLVTMHEILVREHSHVKDKPQILNWRWAPAIVRVQNAFTDDSEYVADHPSVFMLPHFFNIMYRWYPNCLL